MTSFVDEIMEIKHIKSGFAFSGNPIWIASSPFDNFIGAIERGRLVASHRGSRVYEGTFSLPLRVNLADVAESLTEFFIEPVPDGRALYTIEDAQTLLADRRFDFWIEDVDGDDDESDHVGCTVIPGRVSRQNFRKLASLDTDIFAARFLAGKGNFFLTTRSSGWMIVMKETEMSPLYFIQSGTATLTVTDKLTGMSIEFPGLESGVYALDVSEVRRLFVDRHGVLPSVLDVRRGSGFGCRVVVEKAVPAKERYRLKFRNSLGVYDIIEVFGPLTQTSDGEEDDVEGFDRYDEIIDGFRKMRNRTSSGISYEVSTGPIPPRAHNLLSDMLASEEVLLMDAFPEPVAVIPSVEEMRRKARPESPEIFTLKLAVAEDADAFTAAISGTSDSMKPKVFTRQFDRKFN